jgi:hypothetical protein
MSAPFRQAQGPELVEGLCVLWDANFDSSECVLISVRIVHVCDDFVLVIVLLLVIDRSEHEHDYDQEHEGSIGCGCRGVLISIPIISRLRRFYVTHF